MVHESFSGAGCFLSGNPLPSHNPTRNYSTLALSRKGKLVSFFPLKDSHGTTQLIVDRSNQASLLHGLSNVPTESVVLIEGTVVLRPQSARRHVSGALFAEVNSCLASYIDITFKGRYR